MASESVEPSQVRAVVPSAEYCLSAESVSTLFMPLEEGEAYARQILQRQWFRGFSELKSKANLNATTLLMLQKHTTGAEGPKENDGEKQREEWDEWQQQGSVVGADKFAQDRARGEFLYEESKQRGELEWEELADIFCLQLFMEENLRRVEQVEESMAMLQLIHDVMKPKTRQRYIYAWGVVTTVAFPPLWSETERIRSSQRHKPAHMRLPPTTCRIPIEPDPYWKSWELPAPPVALIQAQSEL
ncbi:hypothetical protein TraAM80_01161 [Trypanosoma rangeli]|uniref:Uncharacterized protein n=1 Tax=Trypanosoma rangeli TaxID=5698 RepID=A0A422P041_TRYRA|nr:uncharacterized protein TraAM80_01161 [Trypanosoma rangeli]RNF11034.1 hypothetical protein TraAM80_01161 [Trypanosoma rangeli]|eukprot:RNF11034.1 hypothetical protein TraAM80_01161 [Trypanosoma rangeli]